MSSRLALQRLCLVKPRAIPSAFKPISPFASGIRIPSVRTMATATDKFEFLIIVPDKPGTLEKRLAVRPKHFDGLTASVEDGTFKTGGALLNSVPKDDAATSMDFFGSTLVMVARNADEVRERLNQDIYAKEGVWDLEKAQIYPFKCAFRKP